MDEERKPSKPLDIFDFMTDEQRADVEAGTCFIDVSDALQAYIDYYSKPKGVKEANHDN